MKQLTEAESFRANVPHVIDSNIWLMKLHNQLGNPEWIGTFQTSGQLINHIRHEIMKQLESHGYAPEKVDE